MISASNVIRKETITTATLENAWKAWTTVEGVTSFFIPKANQWSEDATNYSRV